MVKIQVKSAETLVSCNSFLIEINYVVRREVEQCRLVVKLDD